MHKVQILNLHTLLESLPERSLEANKADFGRILVIGGDIGMSGAAHLAGEAALRAGAGLVKIATHPQHAATLNVARPELMVKAISEPNDLIPLLEEATHIIIGPGLGQTSWSKGIWDIAIKCQKPMVIDADALNFLAKYPQPLSQAILTPHPGEAARLLNVPIEEIQINRLEAITGLQQKFKSIIVLKGHHTLISDGGEFIYECEQGNPGMATAGMGDVLSGVIGGLLPQSMDALQATCLGVSVHARAGDLAAESGERGLIASDLFPYIQQILG